MMKGLPTDIRQWRRLGAVIIFLVSLMGLVGEAEGLVYYVRTGSGGATGTSWADAFNTLQQGLDVAGSGDEIWVAEGIYTPTSSYGMSGGSRVAHWRLKNGVAVLGGFPPTGDPNDIDCDPALYETILSGDLLGNDDPNTVMKDLPDDPSRQDNAYHIFYHPINLNLNATAVLDGFTLRGGNANTNLPHNTGGAVRNYTNSSPTIRKCILKANTARDGGGAMFNFYSNVTLSDCAFSGNHASAAEAKGGAIFNFDGAPILTKCVFEGNDAAWGGAVYAEGAGGAIWACTFNTNTATHGGGLFNDGANPTVTGCVFTANAVANFGGAMRNFDGSSPVITRCTFTANTAGGGAAMHNYYQSNPVITYCDFINNAASSQAGGIYNVDVSPILRYCSFDGNSAVNQGGGIRNYNSSAAITHCTFTRNTALEGGGVCNFGIHPVIKNCLFDGNTAVDKGGGIYNWKTATADFNFCTFTGGRAVNGLAAACGPDDPNYAYTLTFSHCILWDGGEEIWKNDESTIIVLYSDVQGGYAGRGNIDVDPLFVQPGFWNDNDTPEDPDDDTWIAGDYHLQSQAGRWWAADKPSADFNDSGIVDLLDFVELSNTWLTEDACLTADLDGDGLVGPMDLAAMAEQFLLPGPGRWETDAATSRCIDAGNPATETFSESGEYNIRVNLGAYGGTSRASLSPVNWSLLTDLNNDGIVTLDDFVDFSTDYLGDDDTLPANFNRDEDVDVADFALLAGQWLWRTTWAE
ncbi:MAG: hypothetical protein JW709_11500 [Sedimentisphaerales bacterium]|nr:hypothetical protein [Sedimentisphaerales bacterium]